MNGDGFRPVDEVLREAEASWEAKNVPAPRDLPTPVYDIDCPFLDCVSHRPGEDLTSHLRVSHLSGDGADALSAGELDEAIAVLEASLPRGIHASVQRLHACHLLYSARGDLEAHQLALEAAG